MKVILSASAFHTLASDATEIPTCPQCGTFRFSTARWDTTGDWRLQSAVCENGHSIAAADLDYRGLQDVFSDGLFEPPEIGSEEEEAGIVFSEQFEETSDRDAVILASVWIDNVLGGIIRQFSIDDNRTDKELLADGNKPLATFSAKIKACYLFGLISHEEYCAANTLRRIRNDFAHELFERESSFEDDEYPDRIRSMVSQLKLPLQGTESSRELFDAAISSLYSSLVEKFYVVRKTSRMPLDPYGRNQTAK